MDCNFLVPYPQKLALAGDPFAKPDRIACWAPLLPAGKWHS